LTKRRSLAGVACVASLVVCAPALAAGRPGDAAATLAYVRASALFERRVYAETPASVAAVEARASEIASECPSALTYAPRDAAFQEITEETDLSVLYAWVAPVRSATLDLAHAIAHLRWSSGRLTRLVRSQAVAERSTATLALPDVCAEIAAWSASAYATLTSSAAPFLEEAYKIEAGVGPSEEPREGVIARLLRPIENARERRIVTRTEQLEAETSKRLSAAVTAAQGRLAAALGDSAL